jgi:ferredoxin-NADP reductase
MDQHRLQIDTKVVDCRREAPDAVTLTLDLQGASFVYRPGQFVEIHPRQFAELGDTIASLEASKGVSEGPRGFSICSDGSDPRTIQISVKKSAGGRYKPLLSPWLVNSAQPGRVIRIVGPFGKYCLPETPPPAVTGYLHLCAGSGVAPNRGMIAYALRSGWPQRHLMILQNRTKDDVFYREEWPEFMHRYPHLLKVRHVLSVDRKEHVSVDLVRSEMDGFLDGTTSQAMVCGPNVPRESLDSSGHLIRQPGFCELWCGNRRRQAPGLLSELGFSPDRVLTEMW